MRIVWKDSFVHKGRPPMIRPDMIEVLEKILEDVKKIEGRLENKDETEYEQK